MKNSKVNLHYTNIDVICQHLPLKDYNQWVLWRTEPRNGKLSKIPYQTNGYKAKTNDPKTWTDFTSALTTYESGSYSGLGFVFNSTDPFVFIDLDNCFDATGSLNGHTNLVDQFYGSALIERSVSGNGLHIITEGSIGKAHVDKQNNLEVYETGRFVALTFDLYNPNTEIKDSQEVLEWMGVVKQTENNPIAQISIPQIPIPLVRFNRLPYHFWQNLKWLGTASKGQSHGKYKSRSEVEMSCLMTLLKYGHDFEDAVSLFEKYQSGHYVEMGRLKYSYITKSWNNAITKFVASDTKQIITQMYYNLPMFKLRSDLNVYKALLVCAYQADDLEVSVSQRTLMVLCGIKSWRTIRRSIGRLEGLIERIDRIDHVYSSRYKIVVNDRSIPVTHQILSTADIMLHFDLSTVATTFKNIGGCSQQIYSILTSTPQTPTKIAKRIRRTPATVRIWLKKLEYLSLAFRVKGGWIIGDATVQDVANVRGIAEDIAEHEKEIETERLRDREKYKEYKKTLQIKENKAIID